MQYQSKTFLFGKSEEIDYFSANALPGPLKPSL